MKYPHIITSNAIVAYIGGTRYSCSNNSLRYKRVLAAINKNDNEAFAKAMQEQEVESLRAETQEKGFTIVGGIVTLDGVEVIGSLQDKLCRMIREGHNVQHFAAFVRNLRQNPSRKSICELYDFMSYAELPITEDGYLLAYKGVQDNYLSVRSGNLKPEGIKVVSGHIDNSVGNKIFVDRNLVDDDRTQGCSIGLHVGSHNYAVGWGARTVLVKVNPAHVVSVPHDCECQKMRVHAYEVVADHTHEIKAAVVDSKAQPVKSEREEFAKVLNDKVASLRKRGGRITMKRLQSSFAPETPALHDLRDVLSNELGFKVAVDKNSPTSVGAMFVV